MKIDLLYYTTPTGAKNCEKNEGYRKPLLLQIELLNNSVVALLVVALEILKVGAAIRNHLEEPRRECLSLRCLRKCEVSSSIFLRGEQFAPQESQYPYHGCRFPS
jgi:hypothetical protein